MENIDLIGDTMENTVLVGDTMENIDLVEPWRISRMQTRPVFYGHMLHA